MLIINKYYLLSKKKKNNGRFKQGDALSGTLIRELILMRDRFMKSLKNSYTTL